VQWVEDMRVLAQQDLAYLANRKDETYFAGYSNIPEVLQAALVGRSGKK
jgi:hypothetical protein